MKLSDKKSGCTYPEMYTGGVDGIVVIQYECDSAQRGFVLSLR